MKKCLVCGTRLADFCITDVCGECVMKDIEAHQKENAHREMIEEELKKAKAKHPKFCTSYIKTVGIEFISKDVKKIKNHVDTHHEAHYILGEELLEACEAYLEGRLDDCLHELSQCGAVVLRMMEYVQAEINAKAKELNTTCNTVKPEEHTEIIICPNCHNRQTAKVAHTQPFWSYVHECDVCGYIIGESEWDRVELDKDYVVPKQEKDGAK